MWQRPECARQKNTRAEVYTVNDLNDRTSMNARNNVSCTRFRTTENEINVRIANETTPIQWQCRLSGLAISNAKIFFK